MLYAFLEQKGVLELGDAEAIAQAKKQYWKLYRSNWKKTKRHQSKSYTVLFTEHETEVVVQQAKRHHTSPTAYIKRAALETKTITDQVAVGKLRELLYRHYNTLQRLIDEKILPEQSGDTVLEEITTIEKNVFGLLRTKKQ